MKKKKHEYRAYDEDLNNSDLYQEDYDTSSKDYGINTEDYINTNDYEIEVKQKQKQSDVIPINDEDDIIRSTIFNNALETKNVKDVIDLAATGKALQDKPTVEKIVSEKTEELQRDAEARKIKAETGKVKEEVEKVRQEMQREVAELEKTRNKLKIEVENLKAEDDKAEAYFNANKAILRCAGIREKMGIKTMRVWMMFASVIYLAFQILLLPFTLIGFIVEQLIGIIESVCGRITKVGWKIVLSILIGTLIIALVGGVYYLAVYLVGEVIP